MHATTATTTRKTMTVTSGVDTPFKSPYQVDGVPFRRIGGALCYIESMGATPVIDIPGEDVEIPPAPNGKLRVI